MNYFDELLKTTAQLIAIDSVQDKPDIGAPFGKGTLDAREFTLDKARSLGFSVKNLDGYVGYADIGEGDEVFGILGHLDTVPIGEGWTKNPYGEFATDENGDECLYGRGVLDDKAPTLACLYAVAELAKTANPRKRIRIIFGLNEESGWKCIDRYNETEKMPDLGISPDADFPVINCEKGIVNFRLTLPAVEGVEISSGERANVVPSKCFAKISRSLATKYGICDDGETDSYDKIEAAESKDYVRFRTDGKSTHGSQPQNGINAAILMLKKLAPLSAEIKNAYERLSDCYGAGLGLNVSDEESGQLTQNLGILTADSNSMQLTLDIRYPISITEEEIKAKLQGSFKTAEITKTHFHMPLFVDKTHFLVQTLLSAYNDVSGENAQPIAIGGGTYARALPCGVAFGPVFQNAPLPIHCPDERLPIEQFNLAYRIYLEAIKRLCF